ncbi:MAG: ERCC4 domain-containing protein [Thermodesulfobacteriota bacterium]|nr:ERCC4 domain-containing protein [Thermodesulfobacteriota bacterium]
MGDLVKLETTMNTLWILESIENEKFPYLLTIKQDETTLLSLRVQERWPGQKGHVFCIREEDDADRWIIEEVERVPVVSLRRYGKRLAVVLDRPKNKRCDFLFLTKKYKSREGEYEQIFWRTERGLKERKPRVKLSTYTKSELTIAIDSAERYPWRFPTSTVEREPLPVGDYALKENNRIVALVERKTLDNLLAEFGRMSIFHQQLSELESYRHAALVIEANYSDFLNPGKMKFYPPAFTGKAIAELHSFHPNLSIIFAGNRKLGQEWTHQFFSAITAHEEDTPHYKISEVVAQYGTPPEISGGSYYEIREYIENEFPHEFTIAMLRESFPDIPEATFRRVLRDLKKEGTIQPHGRGKKSYWTKTQ